MKDKSELYGTITFTIEDYSKVKIIVESYND